MLVILACVVNPNWYVYNMLILFKKTCHLKNTIFSLNYHKSDKKT